jgi:dihydrofolate reductase
MDLIVAHSKTRVIGYNNRIPWKVRHDMLHFRNITLGKNIVMGRKTYDSLGGVLPGRNNFVLSRRQIDIPGATVITDPFSVPEDTIVIGGEQIYKLYLPHVKRMHVSLIWGEYIGDSYFPEYNIRDWTILKKEDRIGYTYFFLEN